MSKYFIGDLMVAQASKTIKKGEEVTLMTRMIMIMLRGKYIGRKIDDEN